jgi:hypothetical protein
MRTKAWTGLSRKSETLSVFDGAEKAKRDLDPLRVVPADVGIDCLNELLDGRGLPVPRVEQRGGWPNSDTGISGISA